MITFLSKVITRAVAQTGAKVEAADWEDQNLLHLPPEDSPQRQCWSFQRVLSLSSLIAGAAHPKGMSCFQLYCSLKVKHVTGSDVVLHFLADTGLGVQPHVVREWRYAASLSTSAVDAATEYFFKHGGIAKLLAWFSLDNVGESL